MSTCISKHGEFSAHTLGEGENEFTCTLCWVEDTDAMRAALAEVTASLRYSENARDIMRREKEHGWAEADRMEAERDAALAELAALRAAGGQEKPNDEDISEAANKAEAIIAKWVDIGYQTMLAGLGNLGTEPEQRKAVEQMRHLHLAEPWLPARQIAVALAAPVGGQAEPSDAQRALAFVRYYESVPSDLRPHLRLDWVEEALRAAAAVSGEHQDAIESGGE